MKNTMRCGWLTVKLRLVGVWISYYTKRVYKRYFDGIIINLNFWVWLMKLKLLYTICFCIHTVTVCNLWLCPFIFMPIPLFNVNTTHLNDSVEIRLLYLFHKIYHSMLYLWNFIDVFFLQCWLPSFQNKIVHSST